MISNHSCVVKVNRVTLSYNQNDTNMLQTFSWTRLLCSWTGYYCYGDYSSWKILTTMIDNA